MLHPKSGPVKPLLANFFGSRRDACEWSERRLRVAADGTGLQPIHKWWRTSLSERFAVSVELEGRDDGSLELHVRSMQGRMRLTGAGALVVVTMWAEGDGTIRARLRDAESGATSYLQGNETMIALGNALGLSLDG